MLGSITLLALGALATTGSAKQCQNLTVPISVSARQGVFNLKAPGSNIDVTNFVLGLIQQGHNLTEELLTGVSALMHEYRSNILI